MKWTKSTRTLYVFLAIMALAMAAVGLASCGGGGGGGSAGTTPPATTLGGVAAAGAPIIGMVTVKDSTAPTPQTKSTAIAADGRYSVDVAGMTAPFMVRADGRVGDREYHIFSAATEADVGGTINVTPLTDLILANIAGQLAEDYYDSGAFSTLTAEEIDAAENALQEKLLPVLTAVGLDNSIDLLRTSFSADHTQLDAALDVLRVTVDPDTAVATITNIINNSTVQNDISTGDFQGDLTSDGVTTGVTDIQAISALCDTFSSLFATSIPAEDDPRLLALFDGATFMEEGLNLDAFLSERTLDPGMIGVRFTNLSVLEIDSDAGTAIVSFTVIYQGQPLPDGLNPWHVKKIGGSWRLQGDQRIAEVDARTKANLWDELGNTGMATGVEFEIRDEAGLGIDYAIVRGPGLPDNGVLLVNDIASEHFSLVAEPYYPGNNFYSMSDSQIASIPEAGAVYTIELWEAGGTPENPADDTLLASYDDAIVKRPVLSSALSAASFAQFTPATKTAIAGFNGGSFTVGWTLPAGLSAEWIELEIQDAEYTNYAEAESSLAPTALSKSLTVNATGEGGPFTVARRHIWLSVYDIYGRYYTTGIGR